MNNLLTKEVVVAIIPEVKAITPHGILLEKSLNNSCHGLKT